MLIYSTYILFHIYIDERLTKGWDITAVGGGGNAQHRPSQKGEMQRNTSSRSTVHKRDFFNDYN